MIRILGIKIIDRIKEAGLTQKILSQYHDVITTRLGFHEVTDSVCSREAYIILHLRNDNTMAGNLRKALEKIGGIMIREITISRDEVSEGLNHEGSTDVLCLLLERDAETVSSVQKTLTSFGCNIRTRLGINETFYGEQAGLIILELTGDQEQRNLLVKRLSELKKVRSGKFVF